MLRERISIVPSDPFQLAISSSYSEEILLGKTPPGHILSTTHNDGWFQLLHMLQCVSWDPLVYKFYFRMDILHNEG